MKSTTLVYLKKKFLFWKRICYFSCFIQIKAHSTLVCTYCFDIVFLIRHNVRRHNNRAKKIFCLLSLKKYNISSMENHKYLNIFLWVEFFLKNVCNRNFFMFLLISSYSSKRKSTSFKTDFKNV